MRAILTYHSIDTSGSVISVSPAAFRRHLDFFASARIQVLPVTALLAVSGDEHAVALTFDDGYISVEREAMPLLSERRVPATIFVPTAHVGGTNAWAASDSHEVPSLPLLDWDSLGRLRELGIDIASHTRTHPHLARLSAGEVADEIEGAANDLASALGVRPAGFAYPYGEACAAARPAVARTHAWACTTRFAELSLDDPIELPRLDAWYFETPGVLESWGSAAFRRWVRRRQQLRRARALVREVIGR